MYPAWMLHKKAQVCPNSGGVPKRFAGISAMACAARAASGFPVFLDAAAKQLRKRWVAKPPGRRMLMVTFLSTTLLSTPDANAVRPARAALDKSSPAIGILTLMEV